MTPERKDALLCMAAANEDIGQPFVANAIRDLLDALEAAERRAEEAERALTIAASQRATAERRVVDLPRGDRERAERAEVENRRLREALDVIATCPAEAVHLMPLAAQAALAAEVPRGE